MDHIADLCRRFINRINQEFLLTRLTSIWRMCLGDTDSSQIPGE